MMKAVRIHAYGGPEVLNIEDIPIPQPQPGEILVKINATSVNPIDWKIREGYAKDLIPHRLPLTLGWDVAGIVEKLGPGVNQFKVGDYIFARPEISKDGTYAEYISMNANEAALMPKTLNFEQAAAVPLAALTAWQSLFDEGNLEKGQRVLIHAAAGGVGSFAVQLAKAKGAYVIATASTKNLDLAYELGANEVVDYTQKDFSKEVKDVDVVLDTIGQETQNRSWVCIKPGGKLVSIVSPPNPKLAQQHQAQGIITMVKPNKDHLREIAKLIDDEKVKPLIDRVLPLAMVKEAQELSRQGHAKGKIVLKVT